jgi:hypothetical protein
MCHADPIGGTYVRCRCRCCIMRPRTHDDVPTGNVGRGVPRVIPRNLELDETVAVPSQTDLNQAEGGRECHFERFMQAA